MTIIRLMKIVFEATKLASEKLKWGYNLNIQLKESWHIMYETKFGYEKNTDDSIIYPNINFKCLPFIILFSM